MEAEVNLDVEGNALDVERGGHARRVSVAIQVGLEVVRIYDHNLNSQTRLDF